jgi:hypothetical protein
MSWESGDRDTAVALAVRAVVICLARQVVRIVGMDAWGEALPATRRDHSTHNARSHSLAIRLSSAVIEWPTGST